MASQNKEKGMSKKLKVDIRTSTELFGGESYSVHIDVTNLTNQAINGVSVTPQYLPGSLTRELPTDTELDNLNRKKKQIIEEMQIQVRVASIYSKMEKENFISRLITKLSIRIARSFNMPETSLFFRAYWAREAIHIDDWSDIERLEKEVILPLDEKYVLKTMFLLDTHRSLKFRATLKNCSLKRSVFVQLDINRASLWQKSFTLSSSMFTKWGKNTAL
jgi:hypothetical protein